MYNQERIQQTISSLEKIQETGVTLADAARSLHENNNVAFDDIWLAVMTIRHLSEKEAMRLTKDWCVRGKNNDTI